MALHWRPVGPEPASTYWMRRAVVALALLLPVVLLLSLLGGSEQPDTLAGPATSPSAAPEQPEQPEPSPETSPEPAASPAPSPAGAPACTDADLRVESQAEEATYRVGTSPRLTLSVTNTGSAPCARDLGSAAVELRIFSGRDRIWSSDDCAPAGGAGVQVLAPGEAQVQRVTWDGRRSLPGCGGPKAQAQAGTYRVLARVGELQVNGEPFVLTG